MKTKKERTHSLLLSPFYYWLDRPIVDFLISLLLSIGVILLRVWNFVLIPEHGAFYSAILAVALGVLSLGTVATTLIVTVPQNVKLNRAISQAGDNLLKIMFDCLYVMVFAIALCIFLFLLDGMASAIIKCIVSTISLTLVFTSALRYLWLLKKILVLLIK